MLPTDTASPQDGPAAAVRLRRMLWVNVSIVLVGIALAVATSRSGDWDSIDLILIVAAFALASELLAYGTPDEWVASSSAPYILAIALIGPAPAIAIGLVALSAAAIRERAQLEDVLLNFASLVTFSLAGGLLCRWLVGHFELTPAEPEFGILILGTYGFVTLFTFLLMIGYGRLTLIPSPNRDRVAVAGQAIAECPTAFVTAAAVLVYGRVGPWGLSGLVVAQMFYFHLVRQLVRSEQRGAELERNRAARGKLVEEVSNARERERIRLASALHDESLQNLYALRQEVTALPDPDGRARAHAAVDRTIAQLRGEILDLNPTVLESAGLADGLRALATAVGQRAGFRTELAVDAGAAGVHDRLLLELAREQLINAAKHAQPRTVRVSIERSHDAITMEVSDDGSGISEGRLREALAQGHVGLASSEERVVAVGGSLSIRSEPRTGTRVTTTLPVDAITV